MQLELTKETRAVFEKDLGEDETGRPMIIDLVFRHETYESDVDIRPYLRETRGSWYSCSLKIEKDSPLMTAMQDRFLEKSWLQGKIPMLSGVRWVSDNGKSFMFCWR
jgi:hypothetical protein